MPQRADRCLLVNRAGAVSVALRRARWAGRDGVGSEANAHAELKDGVLTLRIPQAEVAVSRRAANVLHLGGLPDLPGPMPATVQLDVEGISVELN
ncbi:MAG: hypothetical protein O6758_01395, partial [Planctomycetota bacterium]|nr:hypothetical protein [Planctomycetota bacterium]